MPAYCTPGADKDHNKEKLDRLLSHLMTEDLIVDGTVARDQTQLKVLSPPPPPSNLFLCLPLTYPSHGLAHVVTEGADCGGPATGRLLLQIRHLTSSQLLLPHR